MLIFWVILVLVGCLSFFGDGPLCPWAWVHAVLVLSGFMGCWLVGGFAYNIWKGLIDGLTQ